MMSKYKRYLTDKFHTLLFGKDIRVTSGEPFPEVYDGDFSSYFPVDNYIKPQAPDKLPIYNPSDFLSDGSNADYTIALNAAIAKCADNGGGTVLVRGGSFTVNSVFLRSNVTLFIDQDASLIASHNTAGYKKEAIIYADGCDNIEITGGGKICGEGNFFGLKPVKKPSFSPPEVIDVINERQEYRSRIRFAHMSKYGSICNLVNCNNVNVHNIIFENSASWTLHIQMCNNVNIYDFVINNNRHVANTDGIDINCSSFLTIDHCFISTADDGICIKNAVYTGCVGEMHDVAVKNCEVISCTNAFKIGTETTNDIHNITVENCKFFMPDIYPGSVSGISLEACDGSRVYDITVRNIEMNRVACPLFLRLGNRNRAAKVDENTARATELSVDTTKKTKPVNKNRFNYKSKLYNITVENITAKDIEEPIIVSGYRDKGKKGVIENVKLNNINLAYADIPEIIDRRLFIPEYAHVYPESSRFRNLPSYKLFIRHTKSIEINNVSCVSAPGTWKKENYLKDIK